MGKYKSIYTGQQIDSAIGKAHEHSDADFITDEERQKIADLDATFESIDSAISENSSEINQIKNDSLSDILNKITELEKKIDDKSTEDIDSLKNQIMILRTSLLSMSDTKPINEITDEERNKLNSLNNYDDSVIQQRLDELNERLNSISIEDDLSLEQKLDMILNKISTLQNYDDSELRDKISQISNKIDTESSYITDNTDIDNETEIDGQLSMDDLYKDVIEQVSIEDLSLNGSDDEQIEDLTDESNPIIEEYDIQVEEELSDNNETFENVIEDEIPQNIEEEPIDDESDDEIVDTIEEDTYDSDIVETVEESPDDIIIDDENTCEETGNEEPEDINEHADRAFIINSSKLNTTIINGGIKLSKIQLAQPSVEVGSDDTDRVICILK